MSFELIAVTHPTSDIYKPSLVLEDRNSGARSIIGNVPAGLQRRCNELKIKTGKLTDIFLSGKMDWESVSGLPGMILTVSDQGVKNLNIFHSGNKIIEYMISCWRYFIFRFGLNLKAEDCDADIETGKVLFTPVNIESANSPKVMNATADLEKLKILVTGIFPVPSDSSTPKFNANRTSDVTLPHAITNPNVSTNWIVAPNAVRGKFQVNKARELGVPVAHFKSLCAFESVVLDNGTTITPEQVLEPTKEFNPVLVLDIPSPDHLENTLAVNWENKSSNGLPYSAVYHFIDESITDIFSGTSYTDFINSFDKSTIHFISHKNYSPNSVNFKASYRVSLKWKSLLESFFPLGKWNNEPTSKIPSSLTANRQVYPLISGQKLIMKSTSSYNLDKSTINGTNVTVSSEEEFIKLYDDEILPVELSKVASKDQYVNWIHNRNNAKTLSDKVKKDISLKNQVETLIVGTGSALPSRIRNVISTVVRVPYVNANGKNGFKTVVLDAGEGTLGMLKRSYTTTEIDMLLDELSIVYLSHLHADHHLGIVDILQAWWSRNKDKSVIKPLYIITPWQFPKFLHELNRIESGINMTHIRYLSCEEFNQATTSASETQGGFSELCQLSIENITLEELTSGDVIADTVLFNKNTTNINEFYSSLNLKEVQTCPAFHCDFAYSCAFQFNLCQNETFKISYSGDTRPRYQFSTIGSESDLLLHESTLEDIKLKDAFSKRHSTTSEAIQVGILMKAKKIILTHFSQRYRTINGAEEVYARLANPLTKSLVLDSMNAKGEVPLVDSVKNLPLDCPDPIEIHSPIFEGTLPDEAKEQAKKAEILFAVDNMHIVYSEIYKQREVFEREGDKLEALFSSDNKADLEEEEIDTTVSNSSKKPKKRKLN